MKTAADVLSGNALWACVEIDALAFLRSLPDDSVDLLFTSPPYLSARTYGRDDVARGLEEWVAWMVEFFEAASPKVKGLIAVNCEGQTRNYAYQPSPFLLAADLHRKGFNLRKPVVFHRVGIPGSGGPDWLRNDWEPIVCVTRPGRLPWSAPTACGHPPKYAPGGEMSHRLSSGARVNRWGRVVDKDGNHLSNCRGADKDKDRESRPALRTKSSTGYDAPAIANPGNVVRCKVGGVHMGHDLAHENEAPFPLKLAEFFVQSFCPPGGIVLDPFCGSGTTLDAAIRHGRRGLGCDLRASQVALTTRRLRGVTPSLVG